MGVYKVLVAGHFGAGKTTFVRTASEIQAISNEKKISSDTEKRVKNYTTTSMDFGQLSLNGSSRVAVYGLPGQKRFSFMWDVLSRGAKGFVFMFDSTTPHMWRETLEQIEIITAKNPRPYLLCANKQDLPEARTPEEIAKELGINGGSVLLPCVAHNRVLVIEVLNSLISEINSFDGVVSHEHS